METQAKMILDYLRDHEWITQMDAYRLGITRLAARIADLIKAGYRIERELVQITKENGRKTRIARYRLAKEEG